MNKAKLTKMQRLQLVLDQHGADRARWPAEARELAEYIKETPAAAKLYREARALDQLLDYSFDRGTLPERQPTSGLKQSILADFTALHESKDDVVVPLLRSDNPTIYAAHNNHGWMSAAALAACFALGIYLGGVGIGDWSLDVASDLANLASGSDQFADIADAIMSNSFEEELL